jgi:hypothetical protein
MAATFWARPIDAPPRWSGLTLDRTPIEFSATFAASGPCELRFACEAQADPQTPAGYWRAAERLNHQLARTFGAELETLSRVFGLYEPRQSEPLLAAWHAAGAGADGRPVFKIYLCPAARGGGGEAALLAETFAGLGLAGHWRALERVVGQDAAWSLVSIDLAGAATASIKVYERLLGYDPAAVARRLALCPGSAAGAADLLVDAMTGGTRELPWCVVAYSFVPAGCNRTIFHLPVPPGLPRAQVDAAIARTLGCLALPGAAFARLCARDLARTYVSVQAPAGRPRLATYLAPRHYEQRHGLCFAPRWPAT